MKKGEGKKGVGKGKEEKKRSKYLKLKKTIKGLMFASHAVKLAFV